ncbi:MAG: hypothetical protein E3J25_08095 [Anaerolineales bacterium]|nr:MAG: hypothetical protein E3J25_08095 [Anaerolineales bacterium]
MKPRLFTLFVLIVSLGLLLTSAGAAQRPKLPDANGPISVPSTALRQGSGPCLPRHGETEGRGPANTNAAHQPAWNVELVGQIGGPTYAVAVQGNYAYIGVGPRLVVLDVSNPARPSVAGQTIVLPGLVRDVYAAGDYAYVAAGEAGLRVV